MRDGYPSDVSREQFESIRLMLESAKKVTHPRTIDLYDIFCAVLYVLREGCRWRSLPHDFPKWQNVYKHFKTWSPPGENNKTLLDRVLKNLSALKESETNAFLTQQ
jgi:transposase